MNKMVAISQIYSTLFLMAIIVFFYSIFTDVSSPMSTGSGNGLSSKTYVSINHSEFNKYFSFGSCNLHKFTQRYFSSFIANKSTMWLCWWLGLVPTRCQSRPHRWLVNIVSGNGLVPSGNKPLPESMLTQIYVAAWHYYAALMTRLEDVMYNTH